MNLEGRQKIVSIAIVPHEEPGEEVEGEEPVEVTEEATVDTALPSSDEE